MHEYKTDLLRIKKQSNLFKDTKIGLLLSTHNINNAECTINYKDTTACDNYSGKIRGFASLSEPMVTKKILHRMLLSKGIR